MLMESSTSQKLCKSRVKKGEQELWLYSNLCGKGLYRKASWQGELPMLVGIQSTQN